MNRLLIAGLAAGALLATSPASAQVGFSADPWGAGVQVGPFGFGVGPRYDDHYYGGPYRWGGPRYEGYAYMPGADCRTVRERTVTRHGNVVYRTHRMCD
jgi:hypothetical protein